MKRKLSSEEMILSSKMLTTKQEEVNWLKYQLEYYKLMLTKGLEENYKKTIREYKQQQHDIDRQLFEVQGTIKILQEQMRDGVEVKEEKKVDGKVDVKEKQKGGEK